MWRSKMRKSTALSTEEAEYYSASSGVSWERRAASPQAPRSLWIGFAQQSPTPVYEDNTACIKWGNTIICGLQGGQGRTGEQTCASTQRPSPPSKICTLSPAPQCPRAAPGSHLGHDARVTPPHLFCPVLTTFPSWQTRFSVVAGASLLLTSE
jgi:hypothetical protein